MGVTAPKAPRFIFRFRWRRASYPGRGNTEDAGLTAKTPFLTARVAMGGWPPMHDCIETDLVGGSSGRHILITGSPGVGKTTLIAALVDRLPGTKAGFFTREIREGGLRTGFMIETLDGKTEVLAEASRVGFPRVGKYRVLTESLRSVAVPAMLKRADIIIIDEIGKMEAAYEGFVPAVLTALSGHPTVMATIAGRGTAAIEEIKRRADVLVFEVTRDNRDSIAEAILEKVVTLASGKKR
jgi:nucleoside-triphosphatase